MEDKMAADQTTKEKLDTKERSAQEQSKSRDGDKKKKSPGLFSFLFPILLVTAIIFGVWAYFIKSNKFGLGEKYRESLKNIPIINMVLPPNPDPEAAEYMSDDQLIQKYEEYRKKNKEYLKNIEEQKKTIDDLKKYKDSEQTMRSSNQTLRSFLEAEKKRIDSERKQLQSNKLKFAIDVKNADKKGFADYFEKMDKETAAQVYEKVLKENKVSADVTNYVKTFELMDPASASKVLESMGVSNLDLVANIIKLMKKQSAAEIMANMDPVFASNLSDRIAVDYPIYPEE